MAVDLVVLGVVWAWLMPANRSMDSRRVSFFMVESKRRWLSETENKGLEKPDSTLPGLRGERREMVYELAFQPGAAGLFAPLASVGALLAMLDVGTVLGALVAAGFADVGALLQQVRSVLRATRHETGREGADVGAVAVELNAAGHHLHVRFAEAGGGAVLAGGNAGMEGIEQGLVLGMHGGLGFGVIKWQ